jgi:hypothetical protein
MNIWGKIAAASRWLRVSLLLIAVSAGVAAPASGQHQSLAMLDQLDSGRWELRQRDVHGAAEQICLHDGRRLIQLRHPASICERLIVSDSPGEVTVQYTCRGRGYGRTHIRRETGRLVQIESQGIVDGLPFDFVAEGRRIGDCTI